jgi:hypothetical protein
MIAICAILASFGTAGAEDKSVARIMYPACKAVTDLKAVTDIVFNRTQADFDRFYEDKFHSKSDCVFLVRGESVTIDSSAQDGRLCVRRRDVAECYWTDSEAFAPDAIR